jgi:uncharacterized membrane protein
MARSRSPESKTASYNEENKARALLQGQERGAINVGVAERLLSAVLGGALIAWSLRKRRAPAVLLPVGGGLLARAITGHSMVYDWLGVDTAQEPYVSTLGSVHNGKGIRVDRAVTIDRPIEDLYAFWRDFENLPRFLDHLESVIDVGEGRSHWIARGPAGVHVEWDAELLNEEALVRIAWRSLPNPYVHHAGSVHFRPSPAGHGTEVRVILSYEPPGGKVGASVARLLGATPGRQIQKDLQNLKALLESGTALENRSQRESH